MGRRIIKGAEPEVASANFIQGLVEFIINQGGVEYCRNTYGEIEGTIEAYLKDGLLKAWEETRDTIPGGLTEETYEGFKECIKEAKLRYF